MRSSTTSLYVPDCSSGSGARVHRSGCIPRWVAAVLVFLVAPTADSAAPLYQESHALIIGVSEYTHGWSDLPGVARDVAAIGQLFEGRLGFDSVLVVENGSRAEICRELENFLLEHGAETANRLVIYYAGHGQTVETQADSVAIECAGVRWESLRDADRGGYLVLPDAPLAPLPGDSSDEFFAHVLPFELFREAVADIAARHVMVVFDSCFSGALFNTRSGGRRGFSGRLDRENGLVEQLLASRTRLFITSGTAAQEVPDESIFRAYFADGVLGAADLDGDGFVLGTELAVFLRGRVASDSQALQTPQFARDDWGRDGAAGEVIFRAEIPAAPMVDDSGREESRSLPSRAGRQFDAWGTFKDDCPMCPVMIHLPPATFEMGAYEHDDQARANERPQRRVPLESSFAISEREITIAQWNECFRRGGCKHWRGAERADRMHHPVTGVTYEDASQYVAWLSQQTEYEYRLPTEAEWEYAARAGVSAPRYWGEAVGAGHAHCRGCGSGYDTAAPVPVGEFAPNNFGLYDMLGNVWEWTRTCWQEAPVVGEPERRSGGDACDTRVIRGGSFATQAHMVRVSVRSPYPADRRFANIGFRVVSQSDWRN